MKKRILAAGILMLMFIVTACGNDELVETPVVTDISVDENGTLTAKKGGEATITCTSRYGDRQSLSCKVKVEVKLHPLSVSHSGISGLRSQSDLVLPFRDSRPGLLDLC